MALFKDAQLQTHNVALIIVDLTEAVLYQPGRPRQRSQRAPLFQK